MLNKKHIIELLCILFLFYSSILAQIKIEDNFTDKVSSEEISKIASQDWNWHFLGTPLSDITISGIVIDPEDDNIWYVSSIQNGLYITRNKGDSWEHPLTSKGLDTEGIQIDPYNPSRLLVALWNKLYISIDKGLTWNNKYICPEYIRSIHISKKNGYVYLGPQTDNNDNPGLYRSTNNGESFEHLSFDVSTEYLICWDIEEDTKNNVIYVSTEISGHPQPYHPPLFRSFDYGATWSDISNTLKWHSLKLQVDTLSSIIYFQEEGGDLYKSNNFGNNWLFVNSENIMNLLLDKQHPNQLFGGPTNGGVSFSSNSGISFTNIGLLGKEIFYTALNNNSTIIYAACYGSGIYVANIPPNPTSNLLVTNTNDSGIGSLREAIAEANDKIGIDTIKFNITKSDPNFEANKGIWTIQPDSSLPSIVDGNLVIDGTSQRFFINEDTNTDGPEIVIDGSNSETTANCFSTQANFTEIYELTINHFGGDGIKFYNATSCIVSGCYIGTDYSGLAASGNNNGITIASSAINILVGPSDFLNRSNIISGNRSVGIFIIASSINNTITDNIIGVNKDKTDTLTNGSDGIYLYNLADNNRITNNLIGGCSSGICINKSNNNIIKNNYVGFYPSSNHILSNGTGIRVILDSKNNVIKGNMISYSNYDGIEVSGSIQNRISCNSIFSNLLSGINNSDGGNTELPPPTLTSITNNEIMGTAGANQVIEIFADSLDEGKTFIDSTISNASGNFVLPYSTLPNLPNLTATARDASGNTSEFSTPFTIIQKTTNSIIVSNTDDSGEGSLRNALELANANSGADTIKFNIPKSDPNFDVNKGIWIIKPDSRMTVVFDSNLVINGISQRLFIGKDTNPEGPEIVITGSASLNIGLEVMSGSNGTEIYELTINNFNYSGISLFSSDNCIVSGCYIGTDYTGTKSAGMNAGIAIKGSNNTLIGPSPYLNKPNVISGNRFSGVYISDSSQYNIIIGNYIGLNKTASDTVGNTDYGISLDSFSDNNVIEDNIICGNYMGILSSNSNSNNILRNLIGTNELFDTDFGNSYGIFLWRNTSINKIIGNIIGYNSFKGIQIDSANCIRNLISRNLISKNGFGIFNKDGGNTELTPPVIISVTSTEIQGTARADQIIEIFADSSDEGEIFIDSTVTDAEGNFSLSIFELPNFPNITATARDNLGNTSAFSSPFVVTCIKENNNNNIPIEYALFQNYPNPFNPSTTIKYSIPTVTGRIPYVQLKVYDVLGKEIATLVNKQQKSGTYEVRFNASSLPSGVYFYRITVNKFNDTKKIIILR